MQEVETLVLRLESRAMGATLGATLREWMELAAPIQETKACPELLLVAPAPGRITPFRPGSCALIQKASYNRRHEREQDESFACL